MKSIRHNLRAFTLAEVMIAVAILGIGLVMVASIFPVAANYTRQAATENLSRMTYENAKQQITAHMNATGNAGFLSQVSQAAAAHRNAGVWSSGVTYGVDYYVWDHDRSASTNLWRSKQANAGKEPAPNGFVTGQTYNAGDCVLWGTDCYSATTTTTTDPTTSPGSWSVYTASDYWSQGGAAGAMTYNKVWSATATYYVGDVVVRKGAIYECITDGTTGSTFDPNPLGNDNIPASNWIRWNDTSGNACHWLLVSMPNHPFGWNYTSGSFNSSWTATTNHIGVLQYCNWPRTWVQGNTYADGSVQAFSTGTDPFTLVDGWKYRLLSASFSRDPFEDVYNAGGNWRAMYWPAPLFSTHTPAKGEVNAVPGSPERAYSFGSSTPYPSKDASEAMYTWDALIYTGQTTTGSTAFKVFIIVYSKPRVDETYTCDNTIVSPMAGATRPIYGPLDWMRYRSNNVNKNKLPWLVYGQYSHGQLNSAQEIEHAVPPIGYVGYTIFDTTTNTSNGRMFTQGMKSDGTAGQAFPDTVNEGAPVIYVLPSDASNANPVSFAAPPFTIDSGE